MRMYDLIVKKRNGFQLSREEIDFFINGYTEGRIPDYQASALLMAIYFRGMNEQETAELTLAMANSGDVLDLSRIEGIKADKHSTGGVGDKTSLVLGPMVACLGVPVAKMSGRGLGHTGGTIDKLESFPGFVTGLSEEQFINNVNSIKIAIAGQTGNLAPADKKLYALRDVTGTIENISLIASSIMSKKIAAGADVIVLDVKTGSGAFMKTQEDSIKLAKEMVKIGTNVGRKTVAIISDMDEPLGFAVGNALEVKEAIDTLAGHGPSDLYNLCLALGKYMVIGAGITDDEDKAEQILKDTITSGRALSKMAEWVKAQNGNPEAVYSTDMLPQASTVIELPSPEGGYICSIKSDDVGLCSMMLGGGRETKESSIDLAVGIVLKKKVGDYVKKGDTIAVIHADDVSRLEEVKTKLAGTFKFSCDKVEPVKLIKCIIKEQDI